MSASRSFVVVLVMVCGASHVFGQQTKRQARQEITWLKRSLTQHHVEPKTIDNDFSAALFDKLLDDLDPDRIFFTEKELALLRPFRTQLDDEINGKNTGFLEVLKKEYRSCLHRSEKLVNAALDAPLQWDKKDTYHPNADWPQDETQLTDRLRQLLKYNILDRLVAVSQRDSAQDAGFFATHIGDATSYVRTTFLRPVTRLIADASYYDNQMLDTFLRGMAEVFDPHSTYFSRAQYDEFVASVSSEDYFFGFALDEDPSGNVIISALAPGGPAWKSGALHVSDIIVAVKWEKEARIDVAGMNIEDVDELISGGGSDILEITVKSADGIEKTVALRREKLEGDQNVVQSFILEGPVRVGYIYLPDFYTRWDDEQEGARCANDVASEIIRLKRENIEGIIIDLRFNGGGSLHEARAMAGIFIDEGPLALFSTRDRAAIPLKDMNRGTVYDGPLVLMVNGASASASEVFAAAIQDYNRGLIVGGRTYGKATGQNVFPIEGLAAGPPKSSVGYVKVTTQKLFRITGQSAQGRGVVPDILLPDVIGALRMTEGSNPFALKADSVLTNPYYRPLPPPNRKELQALSRQRISKDEAFKELERTIDWLQAQTRARDSAQSLEWELYSALLRQEKQNKARLENFKRETTLFAVRNGSSKEQRLTVDEYARQWNEQWLKALTTDIHLQETYNVLRDHISLIKKPK